MQPTSNHHQAAELRTIQTARSEEAINQAIAQGYRALIKRVQPSQSIKSKYASLRDKVTGQIKVIHDFRALPRCSEMEMVLDFTYYYPYHFESPFAAYLIPADLRVGEYVLLADVIEDIVAAKWNQGDAYRLKETIAQWNGSDFVIPAEEFPQSNVVVG